MVQWIQLDDFKCPSCPSTGGKSWVCAKDHRPVFLNEKGLIKCEGGTHTGPVITWRWNCGSDHHKGQFTAADMEGFTFALSQAVQLMKKGGSVWVASLITELGKQYGA